MSEDLMAFFNDSANKKDKSSGESSFQPSKKFMPKLMLSLENEMYLFHLLDEGIDFKVHMNKWPEKDSLCSKVYYGEDCEHCNTPSGRKKQIKVKDENGKDTGEIKEVDQMKYASRKRFAPTYLHNNTNGSRAKKDDANVIYDTQPVCLVDIMCGEPNYQTKAEKDRNIKGFNAAKEQGVLKDTLFMMRRKKVKDDKGKLQDITEFPIGVNVVPSKTKLTYKVPRAEEESGYMTTTNLAEKLVVPTDIQEEWDNLTVGEIAGRILNNLGNVRREFFEEKGVIFPPEPKEEEKSEESPSKDV